MYREIGLISKITGSQIVVEIKEFFSVSKVNIIEQEINYISIGSLLGTKLIDGRILILNVEEIFNNKATFLTTSICGVYDECLERFDLGTNTYPIINGKVFILSKKALNIILNDKTNSNIIGTYVYDSKVAITYNPNVLFGKHLGVFGNTGSGKTCTIVSILQNYINKNPNKDIKFIIFDVNSEYKDAFDKHYTSYVSLNELVAKHDVLSINEYGKLFKASEGVQFPALKSAISELSNNFNKFFNINDLNDALKTWIDNNTPYDRNSSKDIYTKNNLTNYLRTMFLRINSIADDEELMNVINNKEEKLNTLEIFGNDSNKRILVIDLQISNDSLDIILFILFKELYKYATEKKFNHHCCLILEEAHRYINNNIDESKLGNFYIDKLAREGRKYGIGLIISSQVPSMLSYSIVSQCNSIIMHKITNKKDMDFLKGVMRLSNDTFFLQMSALEKQYAFLCGEAFKNDSLAKILLANPLPKSNDPVINDI